MSDPIEPPDPSEEDQLQILVQQLYAAETNLQAFVAGRIDAVISPVSESPILLRQAREALTESERRYRRLITRMSAMLFELLPDGTIAFVNEAACDITGYTREEMLGEKWWTLFFPGQRLAGMQDLQRRLETGDVIGAQISLTSKDGLPIVLELNTANRYDDAGRLERVIGLALDVTARNRAREALRRLDEQLLKQQRMLTHRFINSLEEERRALSFELHDGLTQYVMSSFAFLDSYVDAIGPPAESDLPSELRMAMVCLREAVVEARRLVDGLQALSLDELGLVGALHQLLNEEQERTGWQEAELVETTPIPRLTPALETAAYRLAQEALANARRHADSPRVQVTLAIVASEFRGDSLWIAIQDWGKGFAVDETLRHGDHIGLQSMAERVNLLQGDFLIESRANGGTRVCARFPAEYPSGPPALPGER